MAASPVPGSASSSLRGELLNSEIFHSLHISLGREGPWRRLGDSKVNFGLV